MIPSARLITTALLLSITPSQNATAQLPGGAKSKETQPLTTSSTPARLEAARTVFTCPNTVPGRGVTLADGGRMEVPQGWFHRADMQTYPDGSVSVKCSYGIDLSRPADRPAPWVWYDLKGIKPGQCSTSGPNVVCKPQ